MKISSYPFELRFRHPFKIAAGSRTFTPVVYVEIEHDGVTGYGEAALPPYLPETIESVMTFFNRIDPAAMVSPVSPIQAFDYINSRGPSNFAAKAALDMAIHDLYGKQQQLPVYRLWVSDIVNMPLNTYTIGMDTPDVILEKLSEASDFKLLKVKLGGPFDNLIMKTIREHTSKAICVDANQGWTDAYFALDMIHWLATQNVSFVEQPLPKTEKKKQAWLKERSPIPLLGDESIQGMQDMEEAGDLFHGINIKLMKCGGLIEANKMITKAKEKNLKVMLGCMSESTCGIAAAAQLAPMADWTDLDGPLLITNDPFSGVSYQDGRLVLSGEVGIGICKRADRV